MKTPHKHAELIKAWADGAVIQVRSKRCGEWQEWKEPHSWNLAWYDDACYEYRIKPEPKPDYTDTTSVYRNLNYRFENERLKNIYTLGFAPDYVGELKLTFDGETGKLKSAEVIT